MLTVVVVLSDINVCGTLPAQDEMTAVSLATQIQFVQYIVVWAVTGAGAILGAQYWGKKDTKTIRDIFNMMLCLNGLISLLTFAGCELILRTGESVDHIISQEGRAKAACGEARYQQGVRLSHIGLDQ